MDVASFTDSNKARDIFSLIRASPRCFEVFLSVRANVFLVAIRHSVFLGAMAEALAAVFTMQLKASGHVGKTS